MNGCISVPAHRDGAGDCLWGRVWKLWFSNDDDHDDDFDNDLDEDHDVDDVDSGKYWAMSSW